MRTQSCVTGACRCEAEGPSWWEPAELPGEAQCSPGPKFRWWLFLFPQQSYPSLQHLAGIIKGKNTWRCCCS